MMDDSLIIYHNMLCIDIRYSTDSTKIENRTPLIINGSDIQRSVLTYFCCSGLRLRTTV